MHDNDILASLDRGLTQAAAGELEDLGSFADLPSAGGEPEKILITPEKMAAARLAAIDEIADLLVSPAELRTAAYLRDLKDIQSELLED